MKEKKKDRGDDACEKGMGKEKSAEHVVKIFKRYGLEGVQKNQDENPFQIPEDEDKKELRRKSLQIESLFKKVGSKKEERSGERVEAECVSREEIREQSKDQGEDSTGNRRKQKS